MTRPSHLVPMYRSSDVEAWSIASCGVSGPWWGGVARLVGSGPHHPFPERACALSARPGLTPSSAPRRVQEDRPMRRRRRKQQPQDAMRDLFLRDDIKAEIARLDAQRREDPRRPHRADDGRAGPAEAARVQRPQRRQRAAERAARTRKEEPMTTITFHVQPDPHRPGRLEAVASGPDGRTIAYGNADAFWCTEEYETAPYASDVVMREIHRFFPVPKSALAAESGGHPRPSDCARPRPTALVLAKGGPHAV